MNKFRNLKIGTRILSCFIVCSLLFTLVGLMGVWVISDFNSQFYSAMETYGYTQGDIGKMGMDFQAIRSQVLYLIVERDPTKRLERKASLNAAVSNLNDDVEIVRAGIKNEETRAIFNDLEAKLKEYSEVREETIKISETSYTEALAYFSSKAAPRAAAIQEIIESSLKSKSENGKEVTNKLSKEGHGAVTIMVCLVIGTFIFSVAAAIIITRDIIKPMKAAELAAHELAKGNFKVDLTNECKDEVGSLVRAIKDMVDANNMYMGMTIKALDHIAKGDIRLTPKAPFPGDYVLIQNCLHDLVTSLNRVLYDISDTADQVAVGSEQVSEGAASLADSSQEQASSVDRLTHAVETVSSQINANSQDTVNASNGAKQVEESITQNSRQMDNLLQSMQQINDKATEIGKITKTIEDIAFQTNILALNAAVEAARAGSAGKGFAVVADEVRNLANKSQEASKNTSALIEDTIKSVHDGMRLMESTTQSFGTSVDGVRAVAKNIDKVALASAEQAKAADEIVTSVNQIMAGVQTNSATSEESAAISRTLSEQATHLKQLIEAFKLGDREKS